MISFGLNEDCYNLAAPFWRFIFYRSAYFWLKWPWVYWAISGAKSWVQNIYSSLGSLSTSWITLNSFDGLPRLFDFFVSICLSSSSTIANSLSSDCSEFWGLVGNSKATCSFSYYTEKLQSPTSKIGVNSSKIFADDPNCGESFIWSESKVLSFIFFGELSKFLLFFTRGASMMSSYCRFIWI